MEAYGRKMPEGAFFFIDLLCWSEEIRARQRSCPTSEHGWKRWDGNRNPQLSHRRSRRVQPPDQPSSDRSSWTALNLLGLQQVHSRVWSITFSNRFELSFFLCKKVSHLEKKVKKNKKVKKATVKDSDLGLQAHKSRYDDGEEIFNSSITKRF